MLSISHLSALRLAARGVDKPMISVDIEEHAGLYKSPSLFLFSVPCNSSFLLVPGLFLL